jgi:hypothetical protein
LRLIFLISFLLFTGSTSAQIRFNEACSDNNSVIADEEGDYEDWLELYNPEATAIALQGYHLTDDREDPDKWTFPVLSIPAQGFLLIFASDKNFMGAQAHTNFKLSKEGETVWIFNPQLEIVDSLKIPALPEDQSFGLQPDGSTNLNFFYTPSPGFSNNDSESYSYSKRPEFINQDYFFAMPANVSCSCDEPDAIIHYTTNGSIPDENAFTYSSPIVLDTTTTLRIICTTPGKLPSPPVTRTFFIDTNHTLPVVAITTDPENLWSEDHGIFIMGPDADTIWPYFGANFWKDIEVPLYFEYFKNEMLAVEYPLGTRIHGGKGARTRPMKPLRLLANAEFGTALMDYPFFDNKPNTKFRRLVLRNASGDFNVCHMRDPMLARFLIDEGLNLEGIAAQPVVVYVNGIYWGVMYLREKIDEHYLRYNDFVDPDNVDILEEDTLVVEGNFELFDQHEAFVLENDLGDPDAFTQAASYFNLENLSDYFIAQTFVNNTDWPNNNLKYWRERQPDARWKYLIFDMDVALAFQGFTKASADSFGTRMAKETNRHVNIIKAFFQNESFRHYFINRYADLINTSFTSTHLSAEITRTRDEIDSEMRIHVPMWGKPYDRWRNHELAKLYSFAEDRPDYARQYLMEYFELNSEDRITLRTYPEGAGAIQINTVRIPVDQLPWRGYYFNEVPIELKVQPNTGYVFSHWESSGSAILLGVSELSLKTTAVDGEQYTAVFVHEAIQSSVNIMPNPSAQEVFIDCSLSEVMPVSLRVFDLAGRQVLPTLEAFGTTGNNRFTIDIASLPDGVYFIQISGRDFSISERLIKSGR